jgi:hypothetical protein
MSNSTGAVVRSVPVTHGTEFLCDQRGQRPLHLRRNWLFRSERRLNLFPRLADATLRIRRGSWSQSLFSLFPQNVGSARGSIRHRAGAQRNGSASG